MAELLLHVVSCLVGLALTLRLLHIVEEES